MDNKDLYTILNNFYLKKIPKSIVKKVDEIYYEEEKEALEIINKNIEKKDISSDIKEIEPLKINSKLISTYNEKKYSKFYMYNVIQYQVGLEGFTFNLGIVLWNKKTKEIEYKFIEDELLDKLIEIMPNIWFSRNIIKHVEYTFKKVKNEKDIETLRNFIINYNVGYPLEHSFVFPLGNVHNTMFNNKTEPVSETLLNNLYNRYILKHFQTGEKI